MHAGDGASDSAAQLEGMTVSPPAAADDASPSGEECKRARVNDSPEEGAAEQASAEAADEFAASDAWACGANASGALGTGDTAAAVRPKRVRSRKPWSQLALGDSHGAGVSSSGQLFTWGLNDRGRFNRCLHDSGCFSNRGS
jgi:alpha-tubulin suppressor-like RCC1 family protein